MRKDKKTQAEIARAIGVSQATRIGGGKATTEVRHYISSPPPQSPFNT